MKLINQFQAVDYLKQGKTIIFPTETSYGLGCDAMSQEAVDKIFKIKGRRGDKPLLVVAASIEMAKEYLQWNDLLENLANKCWPGPLTVVGQSKNNLANGVIGQDGTVAVRVSGAEVPKFLSEKLGKPVVATSANLADLGDVYSAEELIKMYENQEFCPDAIIDAGILPKNPPTTIVSVVGGELKILRQGMIEISL